MTANHVRAGTRGRSRSSRPHRGPDGAARSRLAVARAAGGLGPLRSIAAGDALRHAGLLLDLQGSAGNLAVQRLVGSGGQQLVVQRFTGSYVGKEFEIDDADARVRNDDGSVRTWAAGEAIPAGSKVGDPVVIPKGTKVKVLGTKGAGDAGRLVQVDGWGWTKATNLAGDFHGETVAGTTATYLSTDHAHKTVGSPNATIRTKSISYPPVKPASVIPKGTVVKVTATSSDGTTVRLAGTDDVDLGWTRRSNLQALPGDLFQVKDKQATRRVETTGYSPTKKQIPIGTLVVVEEGEPTWTYVRVAGVKEDAGKQVKGDEIGWTAVSNLVNGWTKDIYSATATWEKGAFTGQIDVVDIVDEGGDTERVAADNLDPFRRLQQAAAAAGHDLQIESGFRTYEEQKALRALYLAGKGNLAAVAGRSNHQNGIALDLNTDGFDTALYKWMTENAPALGYIRTVSKEHWHWEYHPDEAATLAKAKKFKRAGVNP
jgi:hypothetical protein